MERGNDKGEANAAQLTSADSLDLRPLEQAIGYSFFGRRYAVAALTHSSMRVSAEGRRVASEAASTKRAKERKP